MTIKKNKSFFNVTKKLLNNTSQLWKFNIIEGTEHKYLNIFRSFSIDELDINYFHTHIIEEEDWWDNLSYKYYGTSRLWWSIPLINGIKNPMEEPEMDTRVKILKRDYLFIFLNETKGLSKR